MIKLAHFPRKLQLSHQSYFTLILFLHFSCFQIREVPDDFFVDIISANNFLVQILTTFFATLNRNKSESASSEVLFSKAEKFRANLSKKFNWEFGSAGGEDGDEFEDDDEDAPVVVHLTEEQIKALPPDQST